MAEIGHWLEGLGLGQIASTFADAAIDLDILPEITEDDLEKLGIPLGHRKRLMRAIATLGEAGDVPNLAARLQALAAPGAVVISQATRRLVGALFELEDLGPVRLKGFAEPLVAFRVAGEGPAEGRFEGAARRTSHAAGRTRKGSRRCFFNVGRTHAAAKVRHFCSLGKPVSVNPAWCAGCGMRFLARPISRSGGSVLRSMGARRCSQCFRVLPANRRV